MNENRVYRDQDANLSLLDGVTIGILGYGAQGRSHALNARDSGCQVLVGQRPGPGFDRAVTDGFSPVSIEKAAELSELVSVLLPDELHHRVFRSAIEPGLVAGNILLTCHGFSLHYRQMIPPANVAALLVAPKGAGHRVRTAYEEGSGVPCLIARGENATEDSFQIGLAYAKAIGGTRSGVLETTIAAETETDLFGEQAVLCGGVSALVKSAFQVLVEAGYQPELAYFECLHELKLVVDLMHAGGLSYMHQHISNTAEYGDFSRGPRLIDENCQKTLREILSEIQSGKFANEFLEDHNNGFPKMNAWRQTEKESLIEAVGQRVRQMVNPSANPGEGGT